MMIVLAIIKKKKKMKKMKKKKKKITIEVISNYIKRVISKININIKIKMQW